MNYKDSILQQFYMSRLPKAQGGLNGLIPLTPSRGDIASLPGVQKQILLSKEQLAKNKLATQQRVNAENAKILAERKARLAGAEKAKSQPFSAKQLADETQATGDKLRLFPNDPNSFIDDYLNPGVFIGNMASGLGRVPLNIQEGNYADAALAVGTPLAFGAAEAIATPYINKGASYLKNNIYRINPNRFKPTDGMMYRGLGEEGFQDAMETGVFRPKQHNYAPGRSLAEKVTTPKQFGSTFYAPSNKFGVVENYGPNYLAEVPFEGNQFARRYGRKDWSWSTPRQIPINEGRILQKDWWKGYKEVPVSQSFEKTAGNLGLSEVAKQEGKIHILPPNHLRSNYSENGISWGEINKIANKEKDWLQSEEYFNRRSASTGESRDAIQKDVDQILKKWNSTKVLAKKPETENAIGTYNRGKNEIRIDPEHTSKLKALETLDHEIKHALSNVAGRNPSSGYKNYPTAEIGNLLTNTLDKSHNNYLRKPQEQQVRALRLLDFMQEKYGISRGTKMSMNDIDRFYSDARPGGKYSNEFIYRFDDVADQLQKMRQANQNLKFVPRNIFQGKFPLKFVNKDESILKQNLLNQLNKAYAVPGAIGLGAAAMTNEKKDGGPIIDPRGQWAHPGRDTMIPTPTGQITMQGVPYPVYGQDETGYGQMMYPGVDYQFPGQMVYEKPMMQNGGGLLSRSVTCSSCGHSWQSVDGGSDPLTCHKCGGMVKMQDGGQYVIKSGDTLGKIAKQFGTTVKQLATSNNIADANRISINQKLIVPTSKLSARNSAPVSYQDWNAEKTKLDQWNALPDEQMINQYYGNRPDEAYVIVDKKNARMNYYKGKNLVKSYEVGIGENPGDAQTVTKVGKNGKTDWNAGNKSTGAGVYSISNIDPANEHYYGLPSFNIKNDKGIEVATSIHGTPMSRRPRFNNNQIADNRMSNGCVNGKCEDLKDMYNRFDIGTPIYILPEDKGNRFQIVDGKPVLKVDPRNRAVYNQYVDRTGKTQKGQGVNQSVNTINYKPIQAKFDEKQFKQNVFTAMDFNDEEEYKNTTIPYYQSLVKNKQKILQAAQIPSDVYNELAKMSFGIYGTESNYGDTHSALGNLGRATRKASDSKSNSSPDVMSKATTYGADDQWNSVGYTQIRWAQLNDHEKNVLNKLGIKSNKDFLDPEKAAVATTAILGVRYNEQLTGEQKKDVWKHLPGKWNNRGNYSARVKENSKYLNFKQLMQNGGLWNTNKTQWVDSIHNARRADLDFVNRYFDPSAGSIPTPRDVKGWKPGQTSTHLMADDPGSRRVYPQVVNVNGKLQYMPGDQGWNYADDTKQFIEFPTAQQATWYANNGYKMGTGVLKSTPNGKQPLEKKHNINVKYKK